MSMWTIVMMVAISLVAVEAWPQQGLEPILAEEPGYSCYACAQTGYHGLNRQEVAYLQLKPVERTSLPGYKGSLVRLTDGELVACSWDHFWHSTDEGQSWEEFEAQGVPKSIKESRLICLRDGSVLLTLGDIYRSTDGGRTWEKCARERPPGAQYAHTIVEQSDGTLLLFDSDGTCYALPGEQPASQGWRFRSVDGGRTWPEQVSVPTSESPEPFFEETSVIKLSSDEHLLSITRAGGNVVVNNPVPPGVPTRTESSDHLLMRESLDGGLHWSEPWDVLLYGNVHAHLLKLQDGRILCTYESRNLPFGAMAVLSEDKGKTWDVDHPVRISVCPTCYGSWPTSVQLPDGTMITTATGLESRFEVVRWELPPPSEAYQGE